MVKTHAFSVQSIEAVVLSFMSVAPNIRSMQLHSQAE